MKNRKVYMYVFDTMSDWEVAYLTAELNTGRYTFLFFIFFTPYVINLYI